MSQLLVRKLKKKDKLKGDGKWECEIGTDWSSQRNEQLEGISESADNVRALQFINNETHLLTNWIIARFGCI